MHLIHQAPIDVAFPPGIAGNCLFPRLSHSSKHPPPNLPQFRGAMLKPPNWKNRQSVRRSVNDKVCDEVWDLHRIHRRFSATDYADFADWEIGWHGWLHQTKSASSASSVAKKAPMPAAPMHATPHFVAFFVAHVVVYASSQDFVETALGQPYSTQKGLSCPRDTRYPASQPIPITLSPCA